MNARTNAPLGSGEDLSAERSEREAVDPEVLRQAPLHRLRPLQDKKKGELVVHEIYRSIQGESTYAGLPCVFIRLTACNLRCVYCDTPHAFQEGVRTNLEDVVAQALHLAEEDDLFELTGGEPLLQPEALTLLSRLAGTGKKVLLETSGALSIEHVDKRVIVILDVKTPGSGEVSSNHWPNMDLLRVHDEVKFVIVDRADFDWSIERIREYDLAGRCSVLISGAHSRVHPKELASWVLESRLPLRFQVQLHKIIWGPDVRGV